MGALFHPRRRPQQGIPPIATAALRTMPPRGRGETLLLDLQHTIGNRAFQHLLGVGGEGRHPAESIPGSIPESILDRLRLNPENVTPLIRSAPGAPSPTPTCPPAPARPRRSSAGRRGNSWRTPMAPRRSLSARASSPRTAGPRRCCGMNSSTRPRPRRMGLRRLGSALKSRPAKRFPSADGAAGNGAVSAFPLPGTAAFSSGPADPAESGPLAGESKRQHLIQACGPARPAHCGESGPFHLQKPTGNQKPR